MQPYFFPYIGHFALISIVERWVVFDISQYTPKSWITRNRILHPIEKWQYINVPVKNGKISKKIYEIEIFNRNEAEIKILRQLSHYKNKAPFYHQVIDLIKVIFSNVKNNTLVELNISALSEICKYLKISFNYQICSELAYEYPEKITPGEWALFISKRLDAKTYINPVSGQHLFDNEKFHKEGIKLLYINMNNISYETANYCFEPNLSIIDVLMWNDSSYIKNHLIQNYNLL